jgi:GNAT superfamily N-acetyltransferase
LDYIRVQMQRSNLEDIPQHALPEGYTLRFYSPGDELSWSNIWSKADNYEVYDVERFRNEFGEDLQSMERRCLFLIDQLGKEIGTATSWYEEDANGMWARLHWIAISPEFQGRGLARPLLSAVLNLSRELGFSRALLYTETVRIPAIKLYLDLGFVPNLSYPGGQNAWNLIRSSLAHPALEHLRN